MSRWIIKLTAPTWISQTPAQLDQELGYELLYADTDSIFLKKNGATLEDFISVKDMLARETGLPPSVETCYKFLVLLPIEADNRMEALKHYYRITHTNELIARGIEIRRHDAIWRLGKSAHRAWFIYLPVLSVILGGQT
jgi:DNA polymerase elongation subunit (family B)